MQVVGDDRRGYIQATVSYSDGSSATGPVCGTVNRATAVHACYNTGYTSSSEQGTVDSIG